MASNDVSLQAATNTSEKLENAKSKGWSVGANISVTDQAGGDAGLGGSGEVGVNVTNIYNSIGGDKSEEDEAYNEVSDLLKNYGG